MISNAQNALDAGYNASSPIIQDLRPTLWRLPEFHKIVRYCTHAHVATLFGIVYGVHIDRDLRSLAVYLDEAHHHEGAARDRVWVWFERSAKVGLKLL